MREKMHCSFKIHFTFSHHQCEIGLGLGFLIAFIWRVLYTMCYICITLLFSHDICCIGLNSVAASLTARYG